MSQQFEKPNAVGGPFRLGDWLVEPSLNYFFQSGASILLQIQVIDVLVCLLGRAVKTVPTW